MVKIQISVPPKFRFLLFSVLLAWVLKMTDLSRTLNVTDYFLLSTNTYIDNLAEDSFKQVQNVIRV